MMIKNCCSVSSFLTLIIISLTILCVESSVNDPYKTVKTQNGDVRGTLNTTLIKKIDFYSFKGIPFGKALRFQAPEPAEPWEPKVLDAFQHGNICYQMSTEIFPQQGPMGEDCLFLNVYIPADIKPNEKLAVIVSIFGGAYGAGYGNDVVYGPDFFLEKNVIVVTINYRLGIFGFLNLNKKDLSGNMGLKDQQLALQWVHENIGHFSGDATRVTIYGHSAGASSVHFHVLSSGSRQYFRNAIAMSGVVDDYWALNGKEDNWDVVHQIAKDLNATKNSPDDLIKFLTSVPPEQIVNYSDVISFFGRTFKGAFAPVIERKDAVHPFITKYPDEIYENEKIETDVMFGQNSLEFLTFYSENYEIIYDFDDLNDNFNLILPFQNANLSTIQNKKIESEIRQFYFGNEVINSSSAKQYLELLSDLSFVHRIDIAAKRHAKKSQAKSYYYRNSVDAILNLDSKDVQSKDPSLNGAGHSDELCYIFHCGVAETVYDEILATPNDELNKITLNAIDRFSQVFSNFAKYGTPNPNNNNGFLPIQNDEVNFIDFTNDGLVPGINPNQKANKFWANIEKQIQAINC